MLLRWLSSVCTLAVVSALNHGEKCVADDCSPDTDGKNVLNVDNMNQNLKKMQYAVRGQIVVMATEMAEDLKKNPDKYPFDEVVYCNIGNPQQLGQKPLSFPSQVLSLLNHPPLMEDPNTKLLFPEDVISRAKLLKSNIPGGLGSYSNSKGIAHIRQNVAKFIENRDGYPANADHVFLTDGASPGIKYVMKMMTYDSSSAFMLPDPQYPLYSATIQELGAATAPYRMSMTDQGWVLKLEALEKGLAEGRKNGLKVNALVIINPGNPTSQILSHDEMKQIVEFCAKERLVLLADEVYQSNVYREDREFISFKKVVMEMEQGLLEKGYHKVELFSFHSASKGLHGECGRRGGYLEAVNTDADILAQLYKAASVSLCPNTVGQVMIDLMINPPQEGDLSFPLYKEETNAIFQSLRRRADIVSDTLNSMENVSASVLEGSLYAFPRLILPNSAIEAAREVGVPADAFYCMELLKQTGLVTVPGSGFALAGEEVDPNTYFIRLTFLPSEEKMLGVMERLKVFHAGFLATYA